jgi:catechol 2,3-dioxygenase-like lactoylglutathione lyase family enzyme
MNEQTRTPITDVRTVGVPVTDQDRAVEFYLDKLGFEKRVDVPVEQFGGTLAAKWRFGHDESWTARGEIAGLNRNCRNRATPAVNPLTPRFPRDARESSSRSRRLWRM